VHLIPFLLERRVPLSAAASAVALMGAMQLPGRLLYAFVRRRLPTQGAMTSVLAVQASSLAVLPWIAGGAALLAFVTAFGMASGVATLFRASTVADAFDPRHYGRISGRLALSTTLARAIAPVLAALIYGLAASYSPVFLGLAALLAAAALLVHGLSARAQP
jgi:predicted MFS family arabinose efflux permease